MKVTLLFLVLSGILGVSLAYTVCTKQSDCQEDECCLDTLFFKRAYCEKRYPAGSRCPTASVYKPEEDMYYFTCPCVPIVRVPWERSERRRWRDLHEGHQMYYATRLEQRTNKSI
uniref:U41-Sparatoxin-Hju1e_1 n=1 Tax=Heteropoda jugulans TaxID=1358901 RepID=A0A4Q8K313_9ARAC